MEFFSEAVLGCLEQQGLSDRAIPIIGHSLGALVGLEMAARQPSQVERLALLSVPRFASPDVAHLVMLAGSSSYRKLLTVNSVTANLEQMRRVGWGVTARSVRRLPFAVISDARKFTFRSLTSTLQHCLMHYDVDDVLSRGAQEVRMMLIHGEQDQVAPLDAVRALTHRRPFPSLHTIRGAGHHPFHTHTTTCLDLFRQFLET